MRQPATPVAQLPFNEIKELQQHLVRADSCRQVDGVRAKRAGRR